MRRWVLRSFFNGILFCSALVITSIFILHNHSQPNYLSSTPLSVAVARGQFESIDAALRASSGHPGDYYAQPPPDDDYNEPDTAIPPLIKQLIAAGPVGSSKATSDKSFSTINCEINGEYSIDCLFYKNSVYFPFEFLAKYFEVYGQFKLPENNSTLPPSKHGGSHNASGNKVSFQFEHSNSGRGAMTSNESTPPHECNGTFMNFASFNVERRNKVKFVSVTKGVPLSIQWDTSHRGYHFATQVAQFGLSYYSKLINRQHQKPATTADQHQHVLLRFHPGTNFNKPDCYTNLTSNNFLSFFCKSFDYPIRFPITVDDSFAIFQKFSILNLTFEFTSANGALSFELQMDVTVPAAAASTFSKPTSKQQRSIQKAMSSASSSRTRRLLVLLSYRCQNGIDDVTSRFIGGTATSKSAAPLLMAEITYSLSICPSPKKTSIYRYVLVDVLKGLHVLPSDTPSFIRKLSHNDLSLVSIDALKINGAGTLFEARLVQEADREFALLAADWLTENQNENGGWQIPIGRQILSGDLRLEPGWHDAMAQGQAMSLLVRAYKLTSHQKYATAALKALLPFKVSARENGVVNRLFDKFDWFEEYPTTPGLYVLNGFIYSLIGLYDVATCLSPNDDNLLINGAPTENLQKLHPEARQLFSTGLQTLRSTLPLFDTGYATFYDLRHLSLPGTQPNIARWDYHATHVNQLFVLSKIDDEINNSTGDIWTKTAKRWQAYMKGVRAPHN